MNPSLSPILKMLAAAGGASFMCPWAADFFFLLKFLFPIDYEIGEELNAGNVHHLQKDIKFFYV